MYQIQLQRNFSQKRKRSVFELYFLRQQNQEQHEKEDKRQLNRQCLKFLRISRITVPFVPVALRLQRR